MRKMSGTTAPNNAGKRAARGQVQQHPTIKGCSCKRSQCIKNYCDCYQSMMTCSKFCRCIGCRNTEERKAVNPTATAKSSNAGKRERAAAMSAKAAAAAVKAGNIQAKASAGTAPNQVKSSSNAASGVAAKKLPLSSPALPMTSKGTKSLPQLQRHTEVGDQSSTSATATPRSLPGVGSASKQEQSKEETPKSQPDLKDPRDLEIFTQSVNAALLECMLVQATEGEKMGLNEVQIGHLVMHEFIRGVTKICNDLGIEEEDVDIDEIYGEKE